MGKSLQHAAMSLPRGYLFGLTLSTAGASTTFSIATGECVDSTFVDLLSIAAFSKTTGAWTVGSGNGGMDTGSVAANTWYHAYIIKRLDTGLNDVLFSLSATAPTMPANYTLFRRIGSIRTNGSSQWVLFKQLDDAFLWDVEDAGGSAWYNGATTTSAQSKVVMVPTGIKVLAKVRIQHSGNTNTLISSLDQSDQSAAGALNLSTSTSQFQGVELDVRTDTSAQIRVRSTSTSGTLFATTAGWADTRGKLS